MNFLNLEYFLIIAEEGSLSRAAKRLYVSQQALSEHLKKLEEEVGAPLFKREKKLRLTIAGECFLDGARDIFRIKDRMLKDIVELTYNRRRKITIGIPDFEAPPFLPALLSCYSRNHPEFEYVVLERDDVDISHNMTGIDLYLCYLPLDSNMERIYITQDEDTVAVINNELIKDTFKKRWPETEKKLIKTGDPLLLKELPFIVPRRKHGYKSRYMFLLFQSVGFTPTIGFQSDNGDLNAAMCASGSGVYIGPASYCVEKFAAYLDKGDSSCSLFTLKVPDIKNAFTICYERGKRLHPAEKTFIETSQNFMREKIVNRTDR